MRSERKHRQSPFSAIKDSLDPTQEGSPSELLALCSGQFAPDEDARMVGGESSTRDIFFNHKRSLSDSSTQGVRELLGLTVESNKDNDRSKATDSIARLFSSLEGASKSHASSDAGFGIQMDSQNFTQMSEVIGLCSGVFPTTQMHQNDSQKSKSSFKLSSCMSSAGTSDGMSNHSSSEGEGEEGERKEKRREQKMTGDQTVLRWAKRQRQLQLGVGGAKQGGGGGETESEDEDMPLLKRRRIRVKQKPSKQ